MKVYRQQPPALTAFSYATCRYPLTLVGLELRWWRASSLNFLTCCH